MNLERRVLVLAPLGRDAAITCELLGQHQLQPESCSDVGDLLTKLNVAAGVALVTEEALRDDATTALLAWVRDQPRWSDFPFVVIGKGGTAPRTAQALDLLEALGNIVLLERPLQHDALTRAVRSALQARRRQYEVRAFADTLEKAVAERTAELEAARETLTIALEAAEMGTWDLDLRTDVSVRSARHDEIFGYALPMPRWGRGQFLEHVAPDDREKVIKAFDAAAVKGRLDFECRIVRADRQTCWISVQGRVTFASDGVPVRMTGVVSDITERKEADAQLAQVQKMDTIGQLTGGVAHDFNNLLTPIVGSLDMLRRRHADDDRSQRQIGAALQAAERAATLTQRLLTFARRQALQPQAVDMSALIDGLVDLVTRTLGPTIRIEVDIPLQLPAARVDPHQLELALLNLAVNARDAMPNGGRLGISARHQVMPPGNQLDLPPGAYICVATSDEGVGMDPLTLRQAVEPFFSTKGLGKGTGLGLSMVHGLAAQSGGALHLESEPGKGTTVALWLPATEERASPRVQDRAEPVRAAKSAVVLLVEDEDLVRRATADMLNDLGYEVLQASSGSRALALIKSGIEVDLVVSDYLMPGISGGALAQELSDWGVTVPFLLITGYADTGDDVSPLVERLSKPFRQADLAARLHELLEARTRSAGSSRPSLSAVE